MASSSGREASESGTRYVVLGMHKSGTTLVSRLLHESGIDMGRFNRQRDYDQGNHYERCDTFEINLRLVGGAGQPSHRLPRREVSATPELFSEARRLVEDLDAEHETWGFKDPRTCLTYPFWKDVLGDHRLVLVFRHPGEVWQRYLAGNVWSRSVKLLTRGLPVLRAWFRYNRLALEHIRRSDHEGLLIEYSALMSNDEEFERLGRFVGRSLRDVRESRKYRNRLADAPPAFTFVKRLQNHLYGEDSDELWSRLMVARSEISTPRSSR